MRSSTWREQAGMRGADRGPESPEGGPRRTESARVAPGATPTVGRKAAASGAPEVVELPTNSSDGAGSRTEGLAGCKRRGHDHENTARGAGRSGPRTQRPIPSPCGALSARSCSASGRQRRRRRAAAFGGWWPSPSSASVSQAARSSGVRHLPRNRSASPPGTVRSYRARGPRAASASRPTPSRRLIPRCRSAPGSRPSRQPGVRRSHLRRGAPSWAHNGAARGVCFDAGGGTHALRNPREKEASIEQVARSPIASVMK